MIGGYRNCQKIDKKNKHPLHVQKREAKIRLKIQATQISDGQFHIIGCSNSPNSPKPPIHRPTYTFTAQKVAIFAEK